MDSRDVYPGSTLEERITGGAKGWWDAGEQRYNGQREGNGEQDQVMGRREEWRGKTMNNKFL